MSHEFTTNPIKLYRIDKKGVVLNTIVFIGNVSDDVKSALDKVETNYNNNKPYVDNKVLSHFYGKGWVSILGLNKYKKIKGGTHKHGKDPIANLLLHELNEMDEDNEGQEDHEEPHEEDHEALILENEDLHLKKNKRGGDEKDENNDVYEKNENMLIDSNMLNESENNEDALNESDKTGEFHFEMDESLLGMGTDLTKDFDDIKIGKDADTIILSNDKKTSSNTIVNFHIKFIYDIQVFPMDNIMEFKQKIQLVLDIPVFRQHLWFNYLDKNIPLKYNIELETKGAIRPDIYSVLDFYINGDQTVKYDLICDTPINMDFYKNKDFIKIIANDTFSVMLNLFEEYNTTEFYVIDLEDIIDIKTVWSKVNKDRYQMDVFYWGFICIYFPILTYEVFNDYIKNPDSIKNLYPSIYPNKKTLNDKVSLDVKITSSSYDAYEHQQSLKDSIYSSIKETILSINNYKQDIDVVLILRNIFDVLELNELMPYCKLNIIHENNHLVLRKSYMNEPDIRDTNLIGSLAIKIKIAKDTMENLCLVLFKNGNYIVKTNWREENHMTFEKIVDTIAKKIDPLIDMINMNHSKLKYYNIKIPKITASNVSFTETEIVFYYNEDASSTKTEVIRNVLNDYRKAEIITIKEGTNIDDEYFFNKGMYYYDSNRVNKNMDIQNHYYYLTNSIVKKKWSTIFERTHLFKFSFLNKIKFTISGIKNDTEMEFFYIYIIGLFMLYKSNLAHHKKEITSSSFKKSIKELKNQDPLLYDFKKIYGSDVVYSKICQKSYQPQLLSDDEYSKLVGDRKEHAVQYWNFTKEKSTWYSCPNPKYPFVKFITNQHPKNYCIPCCKKMAIDENVNPMRQEMHKICLEKHAFEGEKVILTQGSNYISTYGKNIDVGRLSRLPEFTLEPLFFDTYSASNLDTECASNDGYYLFGVDQNLPSIANCGYIFCLLHSLNKGLDEFITDCKKKLKEQQDKFRILLDGKINIYFGSLEELISVISSLNMTNSSLISHKYEKLDWNQLFISIAYNYYGVNSIIFTDNSKENINLLLPIGLKNTDDMFPSTHKNLIVLIKGSYNIIPEKNTIKYYPIYLLNVEIFKTLGIIDTRLFLNFSGLITIIKSIIRQSISIDKTQIINNIDLGIVKEFIYSQTEFKIHSYFINKSNTCYALLLTNFSSKYVYIPISISHYALNKDINLIFKPYEGEYNIHLEDTNEFINQYNSWVKKKSQKLSLEEINVYPLITKDVFVKVSDDIIGFECLNMLYYFDKYNSKHIDEKVKIKKLLYHPFIINKMIHSYSNKDTHIKPSINTSLHHANYNYYLYQLVILQYMEYFNSQRNNKLRKVILGFMSKINLNASTLNIKDIMDNLESYEDKNKLKNILSKYILDHHNKKTLIDDIENHNFDFDKEEFNKIKTMPLNQLVFELKKIGKDLFKITDTKNIKNFIFPNILVSCNKKNQSNDKMSYCDKEKFMISKENFDSLINALAHDMLNPLKTKWLFNNIFIQKTIDFFKFIYRKNEYITVEMI